MPRLNKRGDVCGGVGSNLVSANGRVLANGGSASWMDDDTVVYQGTDNHIDSCQPARMSYKLLDKRGAQPVCAGGGLWAAWGNVAGGVFDSLGRTYGPGTGLIGVSRDGHVLWCPDRQAGVGLRVRDPQGKDTDIPARSVTSARFEDGVLVWTQGTKCYFSRPDFRTVAEDVFSPVVVNVPNRGYYIVHGTHDRLLCYPAQLPSKGWVLNEGPTSFNPDAVLTRDGRFVVAWSKTQGEGPASIVVKTLDLNAPMVDLKRVVVPVPPPPSPEPTVALPDKKTALAAVTEARQKYASFSGRLRAYLIVNYVAWKLKEFGAGVYSKGQSGDGYDPPNDGVKEIISSDAIIFKPNWETFDCLNDAEGRADPAWNRTTPTGFGKEQNWRSPVDPRPFNDGPAPEPEPQPTPVTVTVSSFSASTKDGKIVLTYTV